MLSPALRNQYWHFRTFVEFSMVLIAGAGLCLSKPVNASTTSPSPEILESTNDSPELRGDLQNMSLPEGKGEPGKFRRMGDGFYYPFRQNFFGGLGFGFGANDPFALHLGYAWSKGQTSFWQASGELFTSGSTTGGVDYRYIYFFNRSRLRPFAAGGGAILYSTSDQLFNFLRLENYRLRLATGFDYTIQRLFATRAELDLSYGTASGLQVRGFVGLVWPW